MVSPIDNIPAGHIRTASGIDFDVFNPTEDMVDINDIAHALSHQCRFGGHTIRHYSVAEHCMNMAKTISDPNLALQALLHDASEAYLVDLPTPIKRQLRDYYAVEDKIMQVVARKFGFDWPLHDNVVSHDQNWLHAEFHILMERKFDPLFLATISDTWEDIAILEKLHVTPSWDICYSFKNMFTVFRNRMFSGGFNR